MENTEKNNIRFGLIGKNISYSFSKGYFTEKFQKMGLEDHSYENFDFQEIDEFKEVIAANKNIKGFNVTIPYKEEIIPFLSELDEKASTIGAVNTIKVVENRLVGYNTDAFGFQKSIEPFLKKHHKKALILGTGGASKAIAFVFDELGIDYTFVSRSPEKHQFSYDNLNEAILKEYTVLVNCSPLGTFPKVSEKPSIPYKYIRSTHLLFDLIYNPEKTAFLLAGEEKGATICNGFRMLQLQAEKAWEIWNS
ncbi:shikimate dehydrogenase family protein [Costertonia aggregata]|uniref:Shikimate dehydrogenase n=1 Tax=Costertonia aggregata TaxID=343403 RepID=A0A7H9AL97_9FLAO|nr:shikimate dehydrogenase [Costertonia aggregata]QLG44124.1 shikimate dehydrogenase [Costertonia aggregata]